MLFSYAKILMLHRSLLMEIWGCLWVLNILLLKAIGKFIVGGG